MYGNQSKTITDILRDQKELKSKNEKQVSNKSLSPQNIIRQSKLKFCQHYEMNFILFFAKTIKQIHTHRPIAITKIIQTKILYDKYIDSKINQLCIIMYSIYTNSNSNVYLLATCVHNLYNAVCTCGVHTKLCGIIVLPVKRTIIVVYGTRLIMKIAVMCVFDIHQRWRFVSYFQAGQLQRYLRLVYSRINPKCSYTI